MYRINKCFVGLFLVTSFFFFGFLVHENGYLVTFIGIFYAWNFVEISKHA